MFPGFEKEHLEVFLRHAWTDLEYSALRQEARDRLEGLVGTALLDFAKKHGEHDLEINRSLVDPGPGNEGKVAAVTVALVRGERHRKVAHRVAETRKQSRLGAHRLEVVEAHPSLFARLDTRGLVVGVGLPRRSVPDADLFLERMKGKAQRQRFLNLLQELPEGFILGDASEANMPVKFLDDSVLKIALDAFKRGLGWLVVGRVYPSEEVLEGPSLLEVELQPVLAALEKVYAFLALKVDKADLQIGGRRGRGPRRERGRRDDGARRDGAEGRRGSRGAPARSGGRPGGAKRKPKGPPPLKRPPELSDRVRMRSGAFKGRVGTVLDLRKGEAQVRFGLLPVWVPTSDVLVLPPRD